MLRIRRVKCDEVKPSCDRCTSTGRKCDGYAIVPRKKRANPAPAKGLEVEMDMGAAELRAIGFFHHKTAPSLSSYFDAEFWTRLVFQMSYVEPSIRHAMVALGALHEQREQGVKMVPIMPSAGDPGSLEISQPLLKRFDGHNEQFALAEYNKAITYLSKRMNTESSIEVALLACILFVCIEFLRGDAVPAVKHFMSGMNIALASLSNSGSRTAQASLERIRRQILPFFQRIELLSSLFGNEASWDYPVELVQAVPEEFHDMREARDSIVHLANLSVRFIKYMKYRKYNRLVLPDDISRQTALIRQLDIWASTLDELLLSDMITERDLDAAKTLRIHQVVASMWLRKCTAAEECANDEVTAQFETAVGLAEAIHAIAGTREQRAALNSSTFLFDMEIVSPLYYVATKCRHPVIRRRAITILEGTQRREGLWDSNMAAAIAKRTMEIEEAKLTKLNGSELPAEVDRVHNTQISSEVGTNPKKHDVTFYVKPNGIDGDWKMWHEQIRLP